MPPRQRRFFPLTIGVVGETKLEFTSSAMNFMAGGVICFYLCIPVFNSIAFASIYI
jgi:hypothetical protein